MPLTIPDQTIAAQVKVPDAMNTLSNVMNVANGVQDYKIKNANFGEMNSLRSLANDPTVQDQNGNLDPEKFAAQAIKVAPTQGAAVAQGNLTNQAQVISNHAKQYVLTGEQSQKALDVATSLLQSPEVINASDPQKMQDAGYAQQASHALMQRLSDAEDQAVAMGVPKTVARANMAQLYVAATHDPVNFRGRLASIVQSGQGAQAQAAQNLVPASGQQATGTDAKGNPIVTQRDQFGAVTNVGGAPVSGQPAVGPQVIPQNETPQSIAELQARRSAANSAAAEVPNQHMNNRQVMQILDKDHTFSPTGSNAAAIASLSSKIGIPISGDFATDANKISHYLALQTQANEKSMGVSSDASRITSGTAAGSIAMTPQALRTALAVNDATSTGTDFFNRGMEAAVKAGGIPAIRDFQNAWSQNYDPNAMRLYNAGKNNDKQEINDVMKSLGGKDSAQFKDMLRKAQNLQMLAKQGHM